MENDKENPTDNQINNNSKPWLWKKGESGNIMGRPKGRSMKEYAKEYLERMTDEERDVWLEGIDKHKIWEMSEGKAKQDIDSKVEANLTIEIVEYVKNTDTI